MGSGHGSWNQLSPEEIQTTKIEGVNADFEKEFMREEDWKLEEILTTGYKADDVGSIFGGGVGLGKEGKIFEYGDFKKIYKERICVAPSKSGRRKGEGVIREKIETFIKKEANRNSRWRQYTKYGEIYDTTRIKPETIEKVVNHLHMSISKHTRLHWLKGHYKDFSSDEALKKSNKK